MEVEQFLRNFAKGLSCKGVSSLNASGSRETIVKSPYLFPSHSILNSVSDLEKEGRADSGA